VPRFKRPARMPTVIPPTVSRSNKQRKHRLKLAYHSLIRMLRKPAAELRVASNETLQAWADGLDLPGERGKSRRLVIKVMRLRVEQIEGGAKAELAAEGGNR
jgi:hypothetical protein